ncbi:MAG TPA: hypothetical protein VEO95_04435, partial [Chthoniobacteraceae bacterium]|nr:hypothetical protein [Chthoniobacteraceae bacterium]
MNRTEHTIQGNKNAQTSMHAESLRSALRDDKLFPAGTLSARQQAHLDLDGAWPRETLPRAGYVDCRQWGPALRYSATRRGIEDFYAFASSRAAAFRLLGSGDFHHLSALWLRAIGEPFTLVSFDNHPDWDVRPPRWCCGTWLNRALELPRLRRAIVWGCGNFELNFPGRLFANHRALRAGRLEVHPWTERLKPDSQRRWPRMHAENWRELFADFADGLAGEKIYVTVDLDCLRAGEAATNWESGLFSADEIAWALRQIWANAEVIGGDL